MATHQRSVSATGTREKSYFEQQREALIGEIAMVSAASFGPSLSYGLPFAQWGKS